MRTLTIYGLLVLFLTSATGIKSQVTIGLGQAPNPGSILDLRNLTVIGSLNENSDKGLLLTKIAITDINSLVPLVSGETLQKKQIHEGMVVYNTTSNTEMCPGLYYWDKSQWVSPTISNIRYIEGDEVSNSFIVPQGKGIDIPITKVFEVWENSLYSSMLGNVTLSRDIDDYSCEVLWQDSISIVRAAKIIPDADITKTVIRVTPGCASQKGNAVITLKINNTVRWSWHIWVTNYNPENNTNGRTFLYSNGTEVYRFMDRNLGALSNEVADNKNIGLLYQWGRKDPFPGDTDYNGTKTNPYLWGTQTSIAKEEVNTQANLINSIANPLTLYTSYVSPFDWFTTLQANQDDKLWQYDGTKSLFDPCPKGWRVPRQKNSISPWYYVTVGTSTSYTDYGGNDPVAYAQQKGQQFADRTYYTIGNYPAAGYLSRSTGEHIGIGLKGYYWSSGVNTSAGYSRSYGLGFNESGQIYTSYTDNRSFAFSVRCVKDN